MTYQQGCESDPGQNDPLIFSFFSAQASNVLRDLIAYSHIYVISYFGCVPRYNKFGLLSVKSAKPLLTQLETPGPIDRTPGIPGSDKHFCCN